MSTPEGQIKRQILDWLKIKRIFHWTNQAGKIPGRKLLKVGIADILGCYNGRLLAIEVKAENGKLTDEQTKFIYDVKSNGGIAFVARSIEDVEHGLNGYLLGNTPPKETQDLKRKLK